MVTPPEAGADGSIPEATDLAADLLWRVSGVDAGTGRAGANRTRGTQYRRGRRPGVPIDPVFSGPGPDGRDPMAVGSAVAEVLEGQGWREPIRMAAALARWDEIAGPDLAAHVAAESFADGVLTLRADSTTWATQVRLLLPTVRARVDAAVGQGVVANIVVRGPDVGPRQRGAWRVAGGRGPRDTYG